MKQCGAETFEDCMLDHVAPPLNAQRRGDGPTWHAPCPVCSRGTTPLDVSIGEKWIVWHCNANRKPEPPCDGAAIKRAMLAKGIGDDCLGWDGIKADSTRIPRGFHAEENALESLRGQIEALITPRLAIDELRLRLGELIWDPDTKAVADKLDIRTSTYYKYRTPR